MSRKARKTPPPSVCSIVQSLRPEAAMEYRLLDAYNRLFPPNTEAGYRAIPRVESPQIAPGRYSIRFEDGAGNVVPYGEDGALAEVEIEGVLVTATPDEMEMRSERGWQKIERKEIRNKADLTRNEGLHGMMNIVSESQHLLLEANKKVEQAQQATSDMMAKCAAMQAEMFGKFAAMQAEMMERQQQLMHHALSAPPPAPQETWATATPKILDKLGDVMKVAIMANAQTKRGRKPQPIDAEIETPAALTAGAPPETQAAPADAMSAEPQRAAERERSSEPTSATTKDDPPGPPPPAAASPPAAPQSAGKPVPAAPAKGNSAPGKSHRIALGPNDPSVAVFYRAQAQMEMMQAFWPMMSTIAKMMWREMKRRIILLPDSALSMAVATRENFLSWISWVAEPSQFLWGKR